MANRTFYEAYSLDRSTVTLYGSFLSAGATITSQDCEGFVVSQTGTGAYTLTMGQTGAVDLYPLSPANYVSAGSTTSALMDINFCQEDSGNTQALFMTVLSHNLNGAGTISVVFNSAANTPANPASGTRVRFAITLKNSSTPRKGS